MNSTCTCWVRLPTVTVTVAVPGAVALRRVAWATPWPVVAVPGEIRPRDVTKVTSVPSGTGLLFASPTIAVISDVVMPSAAISVCATRTVRPVGTTELADCVKTTSTFACWPLTVTVTVAVPGTLPATRVAWATPVWS